MNEVFIMNFIIIINIFIIIDNIYVTTPVPYYNFPLSIYEKKHYVTYCIRILLDNKILLMSQVQNNLMPELYIPAWRKLFPPQRSSNLHNGQN